MSLGRTLAPTLLVLAPLAIAGAPPADPVEEAVGPLVRIPSSRSPEFSRDGRSIAFISDASGLPQVWVVPAAGGKVRQITSFDDPVTGVRWSPDGTWLAVAVAPGGGSNEQVWLVKSDGSSARRLTDGRSETNRLGVFSADGKKLAIASNRKYRRYLDAYLADLAKGTLTFVAETGGAGGIEDLSSDGRHALLSRMKVGGNNDLFLLDLATKKEIALTPHEGAASFTGAFSPDGRTVWLSENSDRDLLAFSQIRLGNDGSPGPIDVLAERPGAELDAFCPDRAGLRIALLWNVAGRSTLDFFDVRTGTTAPGPTLPADVVSGLSFSRDGRYLAFAATGPTKPEDVFILDLQSRRFRQVTQASRDGLDPSFLVVPEKITYTTWDGKDLVGWLYRPREVKAPFPVVLSFHGGPEAEERPVFRPDYQALAARGIGVFAPNVRGSSGFGKRFAGLDDGPRRLDAVRDIQATVDYLVRAGIADPKGVGIMGGGYGGWMALAGLTAFPDLFAAGADLWGVTDFTTFFENTEAWLAALSRAEFGDPVRDAETLRHLSPVGKLGFLKAPLLVLHGENDTLVPLGQTTRLVEALKGRSLPVEEALFPGEGHGLTKLPDRIRATALLVKFFSRTLKGAP